ncbi:hypothetical protein HK097_011227 [Rhizophlyctis rosea]|uniref:Enoyl reductase (ER) domain-containing protein n=1 Tax=Rhizophlyctis rosea TaxID=64517 RepID=A0AAD5X2M0_9FUNG|nr:hypothetical protein HK097_011227 [Rhizophlyctis rosea]
MAEVVGFKVMAKNSAMWELRWDEELAWMPDDGGMTRQDGAGVDLDAKKDHILGHEIVGKVVALGPGEKKWKIGDRVGGGWHGGHDGVCKSCNRGLFQCCDNEAVNGVSKDGGYAQYATLRTEATVRIPAGISAVEAAPLLCAGVTVFNGIRNMQIIPGGTIAVQGLGGLGHLALQYSRKMGYRTVALSRDDQKKEFAEKLGATDYIASSDSVGEQLQKLGGADLIVVTAPSPKIIPGLIAGLAPRGKLLVLALTHNFAFRQNAAVGDVPINTVSLIIKGQSVHGWPSGHALDSEEAIEFAIRNGVKCMTEEFKLEQVNEAMDKMVDGKIRFRGVLVME